MNAKCCHAATETAATVAVVGPIFASSVIVKIMRIPLLAFGFSLCLAPLAVAQHKDNFPDTPANHWAFQAKADLQSVGLLVGYPDGLGRAPRPASRFELAVAVHATYTNLNETVTDFDRINGTRAQFSGREEDESPATVEAEATIRSKVKSVQHIQGILKKDLLDLLKEFTPELKILGIDTSEMEGQVRRDLRKIATLRWAKLGEALNQFADVPENHWAAGATKGLRSNGILVGYGDGRFLRVGKQ